MTAPLTPVSSIAVGEHGPLDGPWTAALWCALPPAVSKSNHRHDQKGKAAWGRIQAFEEEVRLRLLTARPQDWPTWPDDQPVSAHPRIVAAIAARTMLDTGNLQKSVLDAAEHALYADDAAVRRVMLASERQRKDRTLVVAFAALHPATPHTESTAICAKLAAALEDRCPW